MKVKIAINKEYSKQLFGGNPSCKKKYIYTVYIVITLLEKYIKLNTNMPHP